MKFIIENECEIIPEKIIKEMSLKELEILYKESGAKYSSFTGLELHFDYIEGNNYEGMVIIKCS